MNAAAPLPAAPNTFVTPAPEAILGGMPTASWLRDHSSKLATSTQTTDRIAALGLLARLWMPEKKNTATAHPVENVRAWVSSLPTEAFSEIANKATAEAAALCDAFATLPSALPLDNEQAKEHIRQLCYRRDDLESILAVLRMKNQEQQLRDYLKLVDLEAESQLSALSLVEGLSDERLEEVSWQEPLSWWGRLV